MDGMINPIYALLSVVSSIFCYYLAERRGGSATVYGVTGALFGPFALPFAFFARRTSRSLGLPAAEGIRGWLRVLVIDLSVVFVFDLIALILSLYFFYLLIDTPSNNSAQTLFNTIDLISSFVSVIVLVLIFRAIRNKSKNFRFLVPVVYTVAITSSFLGHLVYPTSSNEMATLVSKLHFFILCIRFSIWVPYSVCSKRVKANFG